MLQKNLVLIHDEVKKYNQPHASSSSATPEDVNATSAPSNLPATPKRASPTFTFHPGTRYPPILTETLALALKPPIPPVSCRRKASAQSTEPSPSPKDLAAALSRLPPLLPKCASLSVQMFIHSDQLGGLTKQVDTCSKKSPTTKSPSSGTVRVEATEETQMANQAGQVQGKLIVTLPAVSVDTTSLGNAKEAQVTGSSTAKLAPTDSREENVITLPSTQVPTSLKPPSLEDIAVKSREKNTTDSSAAAITPVAPPGPNQGKVLIVPTASLTATFICHTPTTKVAAQSPVSFTPLAKDNMSQRCDTLLNLSTGPRIPLGTNPLFVSQNTLHQFLILPPGCIVTNSASCPNHKPSTGYEQNLSLETAKVDDVTQNSLGSSQVNTAVPLDISSNKGLESSIKDNLFDETDDELDLDEEFTAEEEQVEYGVEAFGKPFLTLSESSGSPTPSLSGDDVGVETEVDEQEGEKRQSGCTVVGREEAMESHGGEKHLTRMVEVTVPELQVSLFAAASLSLSQTMKLLRDC